MTNDDKMKLCSAYNISHCIRLALESCMGWDSGFTAVPSHGDGTAVKPRCNRFLCQRGITVNAVPIPIWWGQRPRYCRGHEWQTAKTEAFTFTLL